MANKHGKRYRALTEKIASNALFAPDEAVGLVKEAATAKFDETIDVTIIWASTLRKAISRCAAP
jgi:large subunit ribosomal protein L1